MASVQSIEQPSKGLHITLWIVQVLLAASLLWSASLKLFEPISKLKEMWPWVANNPGLTKFTGIVDLLGALGLVLPMLLRIQPRLTVYAAYGVIVLMIAASAFHIMRGEARLIGVNIIIAGLAAFIAWGRKGVAHI